MNKKCGKCNTTKPLSDFNKNKSKSDGYNNWCSICHYSYMKERGYLKQNQINDKYKTGCGIYKIIIKPTQEVYIGKGYLTPRFRTHKYNLINNKHENPNLQRQFNKYYQNNMEDILDFIILEKCEEYELKYKELYYMTKEFMENNGIKMSNFDRGPFHCYKTHFVDFADFYFTPEYREKLITRIKNDAPFRTTDQAYQSIPELGIIGRRDLEIRMQVLKFNKESRSFLM
jgi:hypothetical protein